MSLFSSITSFYGSIIDKVKSLDFLVLLALRVYLAPIFIIAGWNKLQNFDNMVNWFGNADWGLGLPFPALMVALTIIAELVGGFALLFGWFTRIFSLMLSFTMIVAAATVHLKNGWFAITPTDPTTSIASFWAKLGFSGAEASMANSLEAGTRLSKAREILADNGNFDWLTETGNFVILNNGIEFAATYFIILMALVVYGAGRWLSVDHWLSPRNYR